MHNKSIVFINQDSGYLIIDIINAYVEDGYSCVLITGRLIERNTLLNPTVKVERIITYDRITIIRRFYTWGIGFLQIWWKVVFKFPKIELFIVSNPPFATLLPLLVKNPFQLLIFDIFPDALSEFGYLADNSRLIKWWRKSNKKIFTKARKIFTITESMKQILQKYAGDKVVEVIPIWTDNSFLKPINPAENPFMIKHNLTGKFIVMYSGNIGLSSDVDVLIDIAAEIKNEDIAFLIIGDGAKKEKISEKAKKVNLNNFILLPWQPAVELPFSLSCASLAVIFHGKEASKLTVPSKLYNFLSVGAPLLCLTSTGSEIDDLVTKYECGRSFDQKDITKIVNFIVEVAENKELYNMMKANSIKASSDFNVTNFTKFLTVPLSD